MVSASIMYDGKQKKGGDEVLDEYLFYRHARIVKNRRGKIEGTHRWRVINASFRLCQNFSSAF